MLLYSKKMSSITERRERHWESSGSPLFIASYNRGGRIFAPAAGRPNDDHHYHHVGRDRYLDPLSREDDDVGHRWIKVAPGAFDFTRPVSELQVPRGSDSSSPLVPPAAAAIAVLRRPVTDSTKSSSSSLWQPHHGNLFFRPDKMFYLNHFRDSAHIVKTSGTNVLAFDAPSSPEPIQHQLVCIPRYSDSVDIEGRSRRPHELRLTVVQAPLHAPSGHSRYDIASTRKKRNDVTPSDGITPRRTHALAPIYDYGTRLVLARTSIRAKTLADASQRGDTINIEWPSHARHLTVESESSQTVDTVQSDDQIENDDHRLNDHFEQSISTLEVDRIPAVVFRTSDDVSEAAVEPTTVKEFRKDGVRNNIRTKFNKPQQKFPCADGLRRTRSPSLDVPVLSKDDGLEQRKKTTTKMLTVNQGRHRNEIPAMSVARTNKQSSSTKQGVGWFNLSSVSSFVTSSEAEGDNRPSSPLTSGGKRTLATEAVTLSSRDATKPTIADQRSADAVCAPSCSTDADQFLSQTNFSNEYSCEGGIAGDPGDGSQNAAAMRDAGGSADINEATRIAWTDPSLNRKYRSSLRSVVGGGGGGIHGSTTRKSVQFGEDLELIRMVTKISYPWYHQHSFSEDDGDVDDDDDGSSNT